MLEGEEQDILLCIESSTRTASVAVVSKQKVLAEEKTTLELNHSSKLLPNAARLLEVCGIKLDELQGIVVSSGPGSFTGLRIGLATAKGLCYSSHVKLYAVPTLLSLAHNCSLSAIPVCPMLDAGKKEVYTAVYRFDQAGGCRVEELIKPLAVNPGEFVNALECKILFIGEGAIRYKDIILETREENAIFAPISVSYPRAAMLGEIVTNNPDTFFVEDVFSFEPNYLRYSEAEIKWKQK